MNDFAMTDADYDRLAEILDGFPSEDAMTLEELDGFLAALGCNPKEVPPDEYFPEIWGSVDQQVDLFPNLEDLREFFQLVTRHLGTVIVRLASEEDFEPLLEEDEDGEVTGNDWAQGFLRGMDLDQGSWSELLNDEDLAAILIPIFALACEHSPDPEIRPFDKPVDEEKRELLLAGLSAAAPLLYAYFAEAREAAGGAGDEEPDAEDDPPGSSVTYGTYEREGPKIGRNEPCPCGSGKKYKRCCGKNA
mgnify:CR=1 FL=1